MHCRQEHRHQVQAAAAADDALARQEAGRVHSRLEPVGARSGDRRRNATDHRRREGLRLRHRQRRLEALGRRHPAVVARLQEDRHLPAGSAQDRRDVPRPGHQRASRAEGVEVSAGGRQGRDHDRARDHRRRRAQGDPPEDAARSASLHAVRRHRLRRRHVGRRGVEPRRHAPGVRLHLARSQAGVAPRGRRRNRRRPRSDDRDRAEVLRERQRQDQLALSAEVERDPVVQRARRLGQSVPLRPRHRQAEEPDHARPGQRDAGAVRRRARRA